ncbi:hypothetical protein BWQ96_00562 [Gracilariopsis chorda]|uniref:Uncharacterized protein n=1 Tax=Gracilariopsis chorda TaxID=448386 RepID=A0A2V3J5N0_9FLOR|nr:hypothetical protein BWQ96_00562 [Gracilariopsis chorda]|eukprot:PXF49684.1 hypothetical protein BWQ96_00562 [Gracilariopsis chorda]
MSANMASGPQVGQTRPSQPLSSSEPPKKKHRAAHLMPKLSADDFTIKAIEDVIKIGRRTKARGPPKPGNEAQALSSLLRRMTAWAKQVAPQYSLPEFMFASQAIGTNRSLRPILANFRLAELREVNAEVGAKTGAEQAEAQSEEHDQTGAQTDGQIVADVPPPGFESTTWNDEPNDGWEDDDALVAQLEMDIVNKETTSAPRKLHVPLNEHEPANPVLQSNDSSKQLEASRENQRNESEREAASSTHEKEKTRAEGSTQMQAEGTSNQTENEQEAVSKPRPDINDGTVRELPSSLDKDTIVIQAKEKENASARTEQKHEKTPAEESRALADSTTVDRKGEVSSYKTEVVSSSATEN